MTPIAVGRPFKPQRDFQNLQSFLAAMRRRVSQAAYFQFGDLLWRIHHYQTTFDPESDLRIWEDQDGEICGFIHFQSANNNPEIFLDPTLYSTSVADEMVAWVIERGKRNKAPAVETSCLANDSPKIDFLERFGFQFVGDPMVFMGRPLTNLPAIRALPEHYTIIEGLERTDLPSVTGTPMSRAHYQIICGAPGYRSDLGLRICYQNKEIASGGIGWYDEIDLCGHFEPVGTAKAHRNQGLAFTVLAQMMHHLKEYGATQVTVRTDQENKPAVNLYKKLGFKILHQDNAWQLPLIFENEG